MSALWLSNVEYFHLCRTNSRKSHFGFCSLFTIPHIWLCYTSPGREGDGPLLQYSCLENPMDAGAWKAAVHGVSTSRTRLSDVTFTFHFHALEKGMATHSSVLAWRIPGTGEPGGLPSMGSQRVGHDWRDLAAAAAATIQENIIALVICCLLLTYKDWILKKLIIFDFTEQMYLETFFHHLKPKCLIPKKVNLL